MKGNNNSKQHSSES